MTITINVAETDEELLAMFDVLVQLRPELPREDFVAQIRKMMTHEGYRVVAVREDGAVRAVAGYRLLTMLYCGRLLSVDDLVTDGESRSRGHGAMLLTWLKEEARRQRCNELQLISNVVREGAHRFYFREGLGIECFHFRVRL